MPNEYLTYSFIGCIFQSNVGRRERYALRHITILSSIGDMAGVQALDSDDEFSDDEVYENLPENDFDLAGLTEDDRRQIAQLFQRQRQTDQNSDSDDDEDDDLPLFLQRRDGTSLNLDWAADNYRPRTDTTQFVQPVGPTRQHDQGMSAKDFFCLFYTDEVFRKVTLFTNRNYEIKKAKDPTKHKSVWKPLTEAELRAYYGLTVMKDILKLDRDTHYWTDDEDHPLLFTRFGRVMPRDRYFQIRRYLCFHDPDVPVDATDKLRKVRFILDEIRKRWKEEYNLHREVTIDEAMVPFKGRLAIKQYMKVSSNFCYLLFSFSHLE